ncbi:MAG: hypothetical protein ACLQBX_17970 [Candidatus Limnocylindrales bacterium]
MLPANIPGGDPLRHAAQGAVIGLDLLRFQRRISPQLPDAGLDAIE